MTFDSVPVDVVTLFVGFEIIAKVPNFIAIYIMFINVAVARILMDKLIICLKMNSTN